MSRGVRTKFLSWRTAFAVALLVGVCATLSAAGAGVAASGTSRIVAAAPRLPRSTHVLGAVRSEAKIAGAVVLRPRSEAALTRFIAAVTDKHSPLFHHYLAPGQFAARFGPAPSSIATVTAALRAEGLDVTVAPNGMILDFHGSAAQVEQAFGVGLERLRLADGSIGRARTTAIRLPGSLAGLVTSVVGLDNVMRFRASAIVPRAASRAPRAHLAAKTTKFKHPAGSPTPCSGAQDAATEFGGLTDDQIANAYGAFGLYGASDVGAGQRIGVFELEPFATTDIQTFDACYFGLAGATAMAGRLHTIAVDGGQPTGAGSGESLLDIEDISALAPGATINVYEAPNTTFGALDEYARIVNSDTPDQTVSTSWGLCEAAVQQGEPGVLEAENLLFQQAAAQGQSVFSAAGDAGSNDCNAFYEGGPVTPILSADDPSSQPYVVGVGGTTIDNPTQPALEHVWNDGVFWGAGGGGISESWPMPAWQLSSHVGGVGDTDTISAADDAEATDLGQPGYQFCLTDNPAGTSQGACREVPDVSAQADEFTGGVTVYAEAYGGWQTFGGTSSAAPIWAALLAVTNESTTCQAHGATANGVGFVSPLLYSVASNPTAYAASFNDITAGNNDPYGYTGLFPATTGYDMATGLGSPQLTQPGHQAGLAYYLCTAAADVPGTRPTVSSIADNVGFTSDSSTEVTITGTNFEASSTPDVANIQIGDYVLPQADFEVESSTSIDAIFPAAAKVLPSLATTDGAGGVQVVVTLNDGESSATSPSSVFTYVDKHGGNEIPAVTSVGPYGGSEAGGNTVEIYGSGFTGATAVTFGGVAATVTVNTDWKITATVPAYGGGTVCDQDGSSYGTGENATNDICQTQVVVSNSHGDSNTATILPLYEGDASFSELGSIPAPAGEEAAPASTEYDYFPSPTITSISTDGGPTSLASEDGGSVVTIKGTGLNLAGLEWVDFGDPSLADSQSFDLVTVTGKEIQIAAPPLESETTNLQTTPVTVQTLAGQSGSLDASYAGVPDVGGATATGGPTAGQPAAPDTGGTPIDVTGKGFAGQVLGVAFVDALGPFSIATQYKFTVHSNTDLTSWTVPQNPGLVDVEACTVTACSFPSPSLQDGFLLYPPGDPKIDSITPAKGPASGGTRVTITGENLGCATAVYFGKVAAEKIANAEALLDCGSTTKVVAVAPPGKKGKSVRVTLTTVESDVTGFGPTTDTLHFTYTRAVPQRLIVKRTGSGTVTSSPGGVSCGKTCSHRYAYQSVVKLTATASTGWRFAGWSGACKGKGTCKVRMKSAELVNARFVR